MNLGEYDFGQGNECEQIRSQLIEDAPIYRNEVLSIEDSGRTWTVTGDEVYRELIDASGDAFERCGSDDRMLLLNIQSEVERIKLEKATEDHADAKKRTGLITMGLIGVGLVGMFWMTVR